MYNYPRDLVIQNRIDDSLENIKEKRLPFKRQLEVDTLVNLMSNKMISESSSVVSKQRAITQMLDEGYSIIYPPKL
jgi:hypothetical protein